MIGFSHAKINIGLFVMNKRSDGFHALESVFWPIAWTDALELHHKDTPGLELKITGLEVPGGKEDNLIFKAYNLLASRYDLGGVTAHLHKTIPMGAGLGGGSSNATCMIRLLNRLFEINITDKVALELTAALGSDCPFFWNSSPALVTGRGEKMVCPPSFQSSEWQDLYVTVIHPGVLVSTAEAFDNCTPKRRDLDWTQLSGSTVQSWREWLHNDFENGVSAIHPEIQLAREHLQNHGADYVQMTGTGSAVFGVFQDEEKAIKASQSVRDKNWSSQSCAMNACL
jgi:4-diphosphocytidyl-2-C-methyl-D-erythritol kinase